MLNDTELRGLIVMGRHTADDKSHEKEHLYLPRIRDLREDEDLTQDYIAYILDTSQTMYSQYERGAKDLPLRHLIRLCKLYRVSSDYLLGMDDSK